MARFVLASSSVNRKEILERAGIEFTVIVSNADESNGPKAPDALVKELSRRKLEAVLPKCESDDLVIAADTVVYIDGEILGKPKDLTDANRFMHLLSGHVHTVFTGVCMAYHGRARFVQSGDEGKVLSPDRKRNRGLRAERRADGQGRRLRHSGPGGAVCREY